MGVRPAETSRSRIRATKLVFNGIQQMAGVKGKSGGPRKNAGGARPGAGRKPKPKPETAKVPAKDMLEMLQQVALGKVEATPLQVRAAIAAVQYTHPKAGNSGKKAGRKKEADGASAGRFAPAPPPLRLVKK